MDTFAPVVSFNGQKMLFMLTFALAFACVVLFFLYENRKSRNFGVEMVSGVAAGFALGAAIFFALLRVDVVL